MKKKVPKVILYQKYLREVTEEKEREAAADRVGAEAEKIVIEKKSFGAKFLSVLVSGLWLLGRVILIVTLTGLLSLAVTVLLNEETRNAFFDLMRKSIQ